MTPARWRRRPLTLVLVGCVLGPTGCENATVPDLPGFEPVPVPDPSAVDAVVFLLGDGGATVPGRSPVLVALREDVEAWSAALARDSAVSVVYPGDIVYPVGVHDRDHPDFPRDSVRLWNQIELVAGPAALEHATLGLFLPGNHDWGNASGDEGLDRLRNLADELASARRNGPRVALLPPPGDPGPVVRDPRSNVRIVFVDTHWFLQARSSVEKDAFFRRLAEALTTAGDRHVIMVQHHPYYSAGPHGALLPGARTLGLPFLLKKTGTLVQDLDSPVYAELQRRLRRTFLETGKRPLVFAGGHDHSLQVLRGRTDFDPHHVLVSGAGSKLTPIAQTEGMRYGASRPGYMMLVFRRDEAVDLFVVAGDPDRLACDGVTMTRSDVARCMDAGVDSLDIAFSTNLVGAAGAAGTGTAPTPWWDPARAEGRRTGDRRVDTGEGEVVAGSATTRTPPTVPRRRLLDGLDSVDARAGATEPVWWLERVLFGDLNRRLWGTPFRVPVLDLDSLGGGVTLEVLPDSRADPGANGALRLRGADGLLYRFGRIADGGRRGWTAAARFPLAPMVVGELVDAIGVEVAKPVPAVMPDDPRLGPLREAFAGHLGWLTVHHAGEARTRTTTELYEELLRDPNSRVHGPALLRARLLDMLVGHHARRPDRWRWSATPEGGTTWWEPEPRLRDGAFARFDGPVPAVARWLGAVPPGFSDRLPPVDHLPPATEEMERRLLGAMDRLDYLAAARDLRETLTDSVLAAAVDVLPAPYLDPARQRLLRGLRARRDGLFDLADRWFAGRAEQVDVYGTDAVDVVRLTTSPGGDLTVRVTVGTPDGPVRFERTLRPEHTERVRLYLTEGQDRVVQDAASDHGHIEVERLELVGRGPSAPAGTP